MKLTVNPRVLRHALRTVRPAASSRVTAGTLPILTHALLHANDDRLAVTATDIWTRATARVPAALTTPGAVAVPIHALLDMLTAFADRDSVTLSTAADHHLSVACDDATVLLRGLDPAGFPAPLTLGERDGSLAIEAHRLRDGVESVVSAAAPDDARPALAGIQVRAEAGGLTLAAADGVRLAVRTLELGPATLDALVAWKELLTIVRAAPRTALLDVETYRRDDGARLLRVAWPDAEWITRLIAGAYPDWRRIVPAAPTIRSAAAIKAAELCRAVQLAHAAERAAGHPPHSLGREGAVRLSLPGGDGDALTVTIGREHEDLHGSFTLAARGTGQPLSLTLRARYLLDALVGLDDVLLEAVGPQQPFSLRPTNGDGIMRLVMPMYVVEPAEPAPAAAAG